MKKLLVIIVLAVLLTACGNSDPVNQVTAPENNSLRYCTLVARLYEGSSRSVYMCELDDAVCYVASNTYYLEPIAIDCIPIDE